MVVNKLYFYPLLLVSIFVSISGCSGGGSSTPVNAAPVADAGADGCVVTGIEVVLDGSSSSDREGKAITYQWAFQSQAGSATLFNATLVNPSFMPDVDGDYTVSLVVNDGKLDSAADAVVFTASETGNCVPVADAGPNQNVVTGVQVDLNGGGSYDTDGAIASYQWAFQLKPAGSSAILANEISVNPSFTPDANGDYTISLVVNDGTDESAIDTVTITASNTIPIANAGVNQNVITADTVYLDGSASLDPEGGAVTYLWALESQPLGSMAALSDATAELPTFVADVDGGYTVSLVVNDGVFDSAKITVTITASNSAPTANAGDDQNVSTGATVTLDGSTSADPDGKTVTYLWTIETQPGTATLSNVTAESPTFVANADGDYTISLVVSDGLFESAPDTVVVTATSTPTGSFVAGRTKYDASCASCHKAGSYDPSGSDSDLYGDGGLVIENISSLSSKWMSSVANLTAQEVLDLKAFLNDPSIAP